jgi:hypothetical protein
VSGGVVVVGGLTGAAFALERKPGGAGKMPAVPGVGRVVLEWVLVLLGRFGLCPNACLRGALTRVGR